MSHKTVWEAKGVYWELNGELTSTELFEFNQETLAGSAIDGLRYFIVDCLKVTQYLDDSDDAVLTATQSQDLVRYNKRLVGAFVYDNPIMKELILGYIVSMEEMGAPWQFASFDNLEDARNWVESMTY